MSRQVHVVVTKQNTDERRLMLLERKFLVHVRNYHELPYAPCSYIITLTSTAQVRTLRVFLEITLTIAITAIRLLPFGA